MKPQRPTTSVIAILAAFLALAACGPQRTAPRAQPEPEAEPSRLAPVAWDSASVPDSIATWAIRGCRRGGVNQRRDCVERGLRTVLDAAGIAKAMAALDRIVERDTSLLPEAHGLAHGLGIAAYRSPETVAETFAQCPDTQIAGCYHGVIQGYFLDVQRREGRLSAEALNALCEPHRARGNPMFGECSHGMGHGIMAVVDYRLPDALAACDSVRDPYARLGCQGGAFMENIVSATHPEHTAHSHAALGEGEHGGHAAHGGGEGHGDHAAGDGAAREPWKAVDRSDPLYPCNAVAHQYRYACYGIQTSAILFFNGGDFPATAKACEGAGNTLVEVCWRSLGRDITAYARRDPARSAQMCATAGEKAEPHCVSGAATALVDVESDPEDGFALCRVVTRPESKTECYQAVGRMVGFASEPARREEACATVEAGYVETCRLAASLPARKT
ncbi:MAG TPA: hypothetical protein VF746_29095 [Longimicrobium sp.]|jgi:hypothetical protein